MAALNPVPQIFTEAVVGLPTVSDLEVACSNETCKQSFREYLPRLRQRLQQAGCTWNQPVQVHDGEYIEKCRLTHMVHCSCGGTYRALVLHSRAREAGSATGGRGPSGPVGGPRAMEIHHLSNIQHVNMMWVLASLSMRRLLPTAGAIRLRSSEHVGTENMNLVDGRLGVFPSEVNVSCSGFKNFTRYLVEIMCHALNVNFQHNLHLAASEAGPKTDVLVVLDNGVDAVRGSEKLARAEQSHIPVVNFNWLVESYLKWDLQAVDADRYKVARGEPDVVAGIELMFRGEVDGETQRFGGFYDPLEATENVTQETADVAMDQIGGLLAIDEDEQVERGQWSASQSGMCGSDGSGGHAVNNTDRSGARKKIDVDLGEADDVREATGDVGGQKRRKQPPAKSKGNGTGVLEATTSKATTSKASKAKPTKMAAKKEKKTAAAAATTTQLEESSSPSLHLTLSGMHSNEQKELVPLLRKLGVPYTVGTHSWAERFTHVVTPSMRRNQKVLSALACGRWVVSPEFLRASVNKSKLALTGPSKLAQEKKYELSEGNPHHDIDSHVPKFWREKVKGSGTKAFEALICSVHPSVTSRHAPSKEDIKTILKAGGAELVPWNGLAAALAEGNCVDLVVALDTHVDVARSDLDQKIEHASQSTAAGTTGATGAAAKRRRGASKSTAATSKTIVFSSIEIIQWLVSLRTELDGSEGSATLQARLRMRQQA